MSKLRDVLFPASVPMFPDRPRLSAIVCRHRAETRSLVGFTVAGLVLASVVLLA